MESEEGDFQQHYRQRQDGRVIALIDLDCFYAVRHLHHDAGSDLFTEEQQVEHQRLGISVDQPLVVQQWNGIIAINYAGIVYIVHPKYKRIQTSTNLIHSTKIWDYSKGQCGFCPGEMSRVTFCSCGIN